MTSPRTVAGYVRIEAGTFTMGSPVDEPGREPHEGQRKVTITRPFLLKTTEVTQGEWKEVMGTEPSRFTACGDSCPVERVSWHDAILYLNTLSQREGLPECYVLTGCGGVPGSGCPGDRYACEGGYTCEVRWKGLGCKGYRLPTEAEWEYAARAGTSTALYSGRLSILGRSNGPELHPIAWYGGNSGVRYLGGSDCSGWKEKQFPSDDCGTQPVGSKQPNPWGLHDMLGNVLEWCQTWYGDYPAGPVQDPVGLPKGQYRVVRGGSWDGDAQNARAAYRYRDDPSYRFNNLGFRPARTLP